MPEENTNTGADECKALLERIAVALKTIQEGQVYVIAELSLIRQSLGG